jgi:hypothetical protein
MEAQAWTAIAVLAAYLISFLYFMGRSIDRLDASIDRFEARLDARIDELEGNLRTLGERIGAGTDDHW